MKLVYIQRILLGLALLVALASLFLGEQPAPESDSQKHQQTVDSSTSKKDTTKPQSKQKDLPEAPKKQTNLPKAKEQTTTTTEQAPKQVIDDTPTTWATYPYPEDTSASLGDLKIFMDTGALQDDYNAEQLTPTTKEPVIDVTIVPSRTSANLDPKEPVLSSIFYAKDIPISAKYQNYIPEPLSIESWKEKRQEAFRLLELSRTTTLSPQTNMHVLRASYMQAVRYLHMLSIHSPQDEDLTIALATALNGLAFAMPKELPITSTQATETQQENSTAKNYNPTQVNILFEEAKKLVTKIASKNMQARRELGLANYGQASGLEAGPEKEQFLNFAKNDLEIALTTSKQNSALHLYILAAIYAEQGLKDNARKYLKEASTASFMTAEYVQADPAFINVRTEPWFIEISNLFPTIKSTAEDSNEQENAVSSKLLSPQEQDAYYEERNKMFESLPSKDIENMLPMIEAWAYTLASWGNYGAPNMQQARFEQAEQKLLEAYEHIKQEGNLELLIDAAYSLSKLQIALTFSANDPAFKRELLARADRSANKYFVLQHQVPDMQSKARIAELCLDLARANDRDMNKKAQYAKWALASNDKTNDLPDFDLVSYNHIAGALEELGNATTDIAAKQELYFLSTSIHWRILADAMDSPHSWVLLAISTSRLAQQLPNSEDRQQMFNLCKDIFSYADGSAPGSESYNIACIKALSGNLEKSRFWLDRAAAFGTLPSRDHMEYDTDLDSLRPFTWFQHFIRTQP